MVSSSSGSGTARHATAPAHRIREALEPDAGTAGRLDTHFNAELSYDADGVLHLLEVRPRLSGGEASVQNPLRICTGLDGYAVELMLLSPGRGTVDLEPGHSACALEYGSCATENGILTDTADLVPRLDDLDVDILLIYRIDGDYFFAPPMNVETIMTAFFRRDSTAEAEDLLDEIIRSCAIRTTATHA